MQSMGVKPNSGGAARWCVAGIALFFSFMAVAQMPQPQLTSLTRCGGKAGDSVETKLAGLELEGATLRFSCPGITAVADAKDAKKQIVQIAKDVVPGVYEVRVVGKYGVSNPRMFQVGALHENVENDKHNTREAAMDMYVPSLMNGTAGNQQEDWFRIAAKKGQKLFVRCWASELDSKMVPALALFNANGHELRRERHSPSLEWQATEDGLLYLQLNDFLYKGGADYFYRLEVREQQVPENEKGSLLFWPLAANPKPEVEPNDGAHPQTVSLPCEIAGTFSTGRDVDAYKFHANKGEEWWIEVTSQRLGEKTNPRAVVQLAEKVVLELNDGPLTPGMPDFDGSHLDPVGKFEVKEDGDYTITLRDLAKVMPDVPRKYQLSIRKAAPDFSLVTFAVPPTDNKPGKDFTGPMVTVWNTNLHPSETLPLRVIVLRKDGFNDDIHLSAEGLPSGVSVLETVIGKDVQETALFIRSGDELKASATPFKVVGTSGSIRHEARGTTTLWNMGVSEFIEPSRWRFVQEQVLGTVEDGACPVALNASPQVVEAPVGSKAKVHVKIERKGSFKDPIKFKAAGIAGLEKGKEFVIDANATEADAEVDLGALKLLPGTGTIWFTSSAKTKVKDKDASVNVYSNPVVLKVTEAPTKK